MKIVCTDNFDREIISDTLVCENINKYHGERIVEFLNENDSGNNSPNFYTLVEDDYKLYKFEP
jgi:hypothetical protein